MVQKRILAMKLLRIFHIFQEFLDGTSYMRDFLIHRQGDDTRFSANFKQINNLTNKCYLSSVCGNCLVFALIVPLPYGGFVITYWYFLLSVAFPFCLVGFKELSEYIWVCPSPTKNIFKRVLDIFSSRTSTP